MKSFTAKRKTAFALTNGEISVRAYELYEGLPLPEQQRRRKELEDLLEDADLDLYKKIAKDFEKTRQAGWQALKEKDLKGYPKSECLIVHGTPFLEILRHAKEKEADLIVLGTHVRTGLDHVLFGSTAEKVVRRAPCPVLSVRLRGKEFKMI